MTFTDSTVPVDVLRKYEPSPEWYLLQTDVAITGMTGMEIMKGAQVVYRREQAFFDGCAGKPDMNRSRKAHS